jgi:serine protease AprX
MELSTWHRLVHLRQPKTVSQSALVRATGQPKNLTQCLAFRIPHATNPQRSYCGYCRWYAFSSRGPTKEGRIKPDVAVPGTSILLARSRASSLSPSNIWGTAGGDWVYMGGTSMATPLVAGCVAVLRETLLIFQSGYQPCAALIKALLINGATELLGQYNPPETGQSPNANSGWCRINLANSVVLGNQPDTGYVEADPLRQGEAREVLSIPVPAGHKHLKVTLVWTDPPGPLLQNDLNLTVVVDGQERHRNMGSQFRVRQSLQRRASLLGWYPSRRGQG